MTSESFLQMQLHLQLHLSLQPQGYMRESGGQEVFCAGRPNRPGDPAGTGRGGDQMTRSPAVGRLYPDDGG
jgi:hypothetical protein